MSRTQACCPIKSCTSQLLRYMVSTQLPTSVLTICKHKELNGNFSFSSASKVIFLFTQAFLRLLVCLFVCFVSENLNLVRQ